MSKVSAYIFAALLSIVLLLYPAKSVVVDAPAYHNNVSLEDLLEINKILTSETSQKIDNILNRYSKITAFNGVVMLVNKGDMIYNKAFGYVDRNKTPLKTDMPFQLASVSKQFTAAAIMKLKKDNLLDYNDKVNKYIKDFPYKDVTIKQLLNHTGGMFNYMALLEEKWNPADPFPNNDTLMRMISQSELPLYFKPGKDFFYSNTGYVVLASVVESISKKTFQDFMNENFFAPLGMSNTFVSVGSNISENSVGGFIMHRNRLYPFDLTIHDGIVGDKGIYSTSWDMYKWDKSLHDYSILTEDVLEDAYYPTIVNKRNIIPYGFGFRLSDENGQRMVYHNGVWEGFRINYHRYPDSKSAVLVMNNSGHNISALTAGIKYALNNLEDENIETRFVVHCLLSNNFKAAQYAYFLARFEDCFDKDIFNEIKEYLWRNKYYRFYEDFSFLVPETF